MQLPKNVVKNEISLADALRTVRLNYYKVVMTTGVFDLIHYGHIAYLEKSARRGYILLVGVDSDKLVKKVKGSGRPVQTEQERACIVSFLNCVHLVYVASDWSPIIRLARPEVFVTSQSTCPLEKRYDYRALLEVQSRIENFPPMSENHTSHTIGKIVDLYC